MRFLKTSQPKGSVTIDEKENDNPVLPAKYPKPSILLIDIDNKVGEALKDTGFDIAEGSFGCPYHVDKKSAYCQLLLNSEFPLEFGEKEIVVIDLSPQKPLSEPTGRVVQLADGSGVFAEMHFGVVDPRPYAMLAARDRFDRIYKHGGIFIVFANEKVDVDYRSGNPPYIDSNPYLSSLNNWGFLSRLNSWEFKAKHDIGKEIATVRGIFSGVSDQIQNALSLCTIEARDYSDSKWITLATNKFNAAIAGAIIPSEDELGWIFIFPHVSDKPKFLSKLLKDILPDLQPSLFPYFEARKWIENPEYDLPQVLTLKAQIASIQEDAARQVAILQQKIQVERESTQYLRELLTQTDRALVLSIKESLEVIGFRNVIDMDKELEESGSKESKREDLQIRESACYLLIEAKGVIGTAKDADALQVSKYIAPRLKALIADGKHNIDVRGLSIVNHERNIPGLDRKRIPFNQDILDSATRDDMGFGLLTTWNLYRLVRNYLKLGWKHEQIASLFYINGFIEPIPLHYEYIGPVERFIPKLGVVGIRIECNELKLGDRIAFELPIEFEEQAIDSLQLENQPVEVASQGTLAGVKTELGKKDLKLEATRVFRVKTSI